MVTWVTILIFSRLKTEILKRNFYTKLYKLSKKNLYFSFVHIFNNGYLGTHIVFLRLSGHFDEKLYAFKETFQFFTILSWNCLHILQFNTLTIYSGYSGTQWKSVY